MTRPPGILETIFISIIAGIILLMIYLIFVPVYAKMAEGYMKMREFRLHQRRYMKFGRAQFFGEFKPISREK